MFTRSRLAVAGAAGLLVAALPLFAKVPQKTKPKAAPLETAVIENTGSTNTLGYKITVMLTGDLVKGTAVENGGNEYRAEISNNGAFKKQVQQFVIDLNAAMPLSELPVRHGMRSASFGTQTYITYKGQKSPDLTFASDPRTVALKADIDSITKALHVGNAPRRPIVIHADR